jgi:hypothetical protein
MSILRDQTTRDPAIHSLESEIHLLREEIFALADAARREVPHDLTELHVCLQTASNELGEAERVLRRASRAPVLA